MCETSAATYIWTPLSECQLRLCHALGQTTAQIAERLGCDPPLIDAACAHLDAAAKIDLPALLDLFERYDLLRNVHEIIDARSGSTEQARLRASLLARAKMIQARSETEMHESETLLKTLNELGAMRADELRDHVANLVSGLEHKNRILRRRDSAAQDATVSGDGTSATKTTAG